MNEIRSRKKDLIKQLLVSQADEKILTSSLTSETIHQKRKDKTISLRAEIVEFEKSQQKSLEFGEIEIGRLINRIRASDEINAEVSSLTSKIMNEMIFGYRQAVDTLIETAKKEVSLLQDSYESEFDQEELQLRATIDALKNLTHGISSKDSQKFDDILSVHKTAISDIVNEGENIRNSATAKQSVEVESLRASIERERMQHAAFMEVPEKDLSRAETTAKTSEESFQQRQKLFKKYTSDIRIMNNKLAELAISDDNQQLMVTKMELMKKVNALRRSIKMNSKLKKLQMMQLSRDHESHRERLQAEIDLMSDIKRLTSLCGLERGSDVYQGIAQATTELTAVNMQIKSLTDQNLMLKHEIKSIIRGKAITDKTVDVALRGTPL